MHRRAVALHQVRDRAEDQPLALRQCSCPASKTGETTCTVK
jgi:hypothetical protein